MEIAKVIAVTCGPGLLIFMAFFLLTYKSVITADDMIRIPKRLIRKVIMSNEEQAAITIQECVKLRKCLASLDIPLGDKRSLMWRIESIEEDAVRKFSKLLVDEKLEEMKKDCIQIEENRK